LATQATQPTISWSWKAEVESRNCRLFESEVVSTDFDLASLVAMEYFPGFSGRNENKFKELEGVLTMDEQQALTD